MDQILLFLISSLALTLMPGPDILFVLNQSLENKKSGFLISFGLCSGLIIHTLILVFGLSVFIESNEYMINYLKYFFSTDQIFKIISSLGFRDLDFYHYRRSWTVKQSFFKNFVDHCV